MDDERQVKRVWLARRVTKRRRGKPNKTRDEQIGGTVTQKVILWKEQCQKRVVEKVDKGHLILGKISPTSFCGRRVVDYICISTKK